MQSFSDQRVLIIGGSSGMGLALAERILRAGGTAIIAGRSAAKLDKAASQLAPHGAVETAVADIGSEEAVKRLFAATGTVHHIVVTAVDTAGAVGPISELPVSALSDFLNIKLIGPWLIAKYGAPQLAPGGSLTFTSGIAAYRPTFSGSIVASVNGALENLAYALAIELAPARVNVVSPGWVDTPVWDVLAGPDKSAMFADLAKRLPAGRVGTADDIAEAFLSVMVNGFLTGTVIHVDGGQRLV
jgi:NAD(P)-dependent dehydrogenase (short-subunit alcohol dehydrogenase family)